MNRRHFGLSIATAIFLTRQLREAIAQDASQSSSSVDTDAARRMRDAAGAFLESLDEAARRADTDPDQLSFLHAVRVRGPPQAPCRCRHSPLGSGGPS